MLEYFSASENPYNFQLVGFAISRYGLVKEASLHDATSLE